MNAIALIDQQHEAIAAMFAKLETDMLPSVRQHRVLQLAAAMHVHAVVEQKVFYPALKVRETVDLLMGAVDGHQNLVARVSELLGMQVTQAQYAERLQALRRQFDHHVEAQRADLFPRARKLHDKAGLESLGQEIEKMASLLTDGPPV